MSKITRRCGVRDIAPSTHLAFSRPNPSTLPSWVSTFRTGSWCWCLPLVCLCLGLQRSGQTTVHRLPEKAGAARYDRPDSPADIHPPSPSVPVHRSNSRQARASEVIGTVELQPYTSVETEHWRGGWCFHPLGASQSRTKADDQSSTQPICSAIFGLSSGSS